MKKAILLSAFMATTFLASSQIKSLKQDSLKTDTISISKALAAKLFPAIQNSVKALSQSRGISAGDASESIEAFGELNKKIMEKYSQSKSATTSITNK